MSTPVNSLVGYSGAGGYTVTVSGGGAGGGGGVSPNYRLVAEKLEEWEWFNRFIEQNPDIKERYEAHKTYEILNNDNGTR